MMLVLIITLLQILFTFLKSNLVAQVQFRKIFVTTKNEDLGTCTIPSPKR